MPKLVVALVAAAALVVAFEAWAGPAGDAVSIQVTPTIETEPAPSAGDGAPTLTPSADSFVNEDSGNKNYGADTEMKVDGDSVKHSFVRFDLSSISLGSQIDSATLTLCLTSNRAQGHFHELRVVEESWEESSITWNNQPSVSATITDTVTVPDLPTCVNWNVMSDVQSWVDGAPNNGWRINDQEEEDGNAKYATRENLDPSLRPKLEVSIVGDVQGDSLISTVSLGADVFVFARGVTNELLYRQRKDGVWTDWINLGGILNATPAAVAAGSDLYVFVRDSGNSLSYRKLSGGVWGDWEPLGGIISGVPSAVATAADDVNVFVRGSGEDVWYRHFNGTIWEGWTPLGGILTAGPTAVAAGTDIFVFGRGQGLDLWYRRLSGGVWSEWQALGGILTSFPTAAAIGPNDLYVFARGDGRDVWYRRWNGASFEGWQPLGGIVKFGPTATAAGADVYIFAAGSDADLWYRRLNGGVWEDWRRLGGTLTSAPAGVAVENSVYTFVRGTSREFWYRRWNGTDWEPWTSLGGVGGDYQVVPALSTANFDRMIDLEPIPGSPDDVAVATQGGEIWRVPLSGGAPSLFGDVSTLLNEIGLLSLTFSPDYQDDDRVYLHYSASSPRRSVFSRFVVVAGAIDLASEEVIIEVNQQFGDHNGGKIAFGEDGYLYIPLGDGGSHGDPQGNGQNLGTHPSAILRLDVSASGSGYVVPPDNPFISTSGALPEIWAHGFRNPWRFSFDSLTGIPWVADVGEDAWEEVEPVIAGGNYGWNTMEGFECYNPPSGCDMTGKELPRAAYGHVNGNCSVIGGYVYRGSVMPELYGWYVYADFCSGRIWAVNTVGNGAPIQLTDTPYPIVSFGQLQDGELVILAFPNAIYQLQRIP